MDEFSAPFGQLASVWRGNKLRELDERIISLREEIRVLERRIEITEDRVDQIQSWDEEQLVRDFCRVEGW